LEDEMIRHYEIIDECFTGCQKLFLRPSNRWNKLKSRKDDKDGETSTYSQVKCEMGGSEEI